MNDTDRNTRTLIVSFMIAIFALIPLRFVEAGEQFEQTAFGVSSQQVLGESVEIEVPKLPEPRIEAPYDEIEGMTEEVEVNGL